MSNWKCLVIIFNECDVMLDGKHFTDKLSFAEKTDAATGFTNFTNFVATATGGKTTVTFEPALELKTLKHMSSYASTPVDPADPKKGMIAWASPRNIYDSIIAEKGTLDIQWGKYDSIFVLQPWEDNPGCLNKHYHLNGLGYFPATAFTEGNPRAVINAAEAAFGATYAWFGGLHDMKKHKAGLITHEWLHGVCQFYKHYDFPIPEGESHADPAWKYTDASPDGWSTFYNDVLSGNIKDQFTPPTPPTPRGGISDAAWAAGIPGTPNNLIGLGSSDPKSFKAAWKNQPGVPSAKSTKGRLAHRWGDGEAQDMVGPEGRCAIMRGDGRSAFVVPPKFWRKFLDSGDVNVLGYPTSDVHDWGKGKVIDFETKSGWHSGIMEARSSGAMHVVKGLIWKAYTASPGNGATSYLGHPKGDEFAWTNPDNKKIYNVQFFDGGYCWAQSFSPYKYGNDKQWGNQEQNDLLAISESFQLQDSHALDASCACCQPRLSSGVAIAAATPETVRDESRTELAEDA